MEHSQNAAQMWLRKAESDLAAAEWLLRGPELEAQACFQAQQTAEKALKGVASHLGVGDIPKAHDLTALADLVLGQGQTMPVSAERLESFDSFAVEVRYSALQLPGPEEAAAAVAIARELVAWAQALIDRE
jgi:HEPN domain-containing protein